MEEFIEVFSTLFEVHIALVAEFYGIIHTIKEAQKIRLINVWLKCDSVLVCASLLLLVL